MNLEKNDLLDYIWEKDIILNRQFLKHGLKWLAIFTPAMLYTLNDNIYSIYNILFCRSLLGL